MLKPNSDIMLESNRPGCAQTHESASRCSAARLDELLVHSIKLRDLYRSARCRTDDIPSLGLHILFDKHYKEQLRLVAVVLDRLRMLGHETSVLAAHPLQGTQCSHALGGRILPILLLLDLLDAHDTVLASAQTGATSDGCPYTVSSQDFAVTQVVLVNNVQFRLISEQLIARWDRRRVSVAYLDGKDAHG